MKISGFTADNSLNAVNLANVQIGQVIDWYRPSVAFSPPSNFIILNGTAISDSESPLNGLTRPSSNTRFIRGGNLASLDATGGTATDSFAHTHTNSHTHTDNITHTHTGNSDNDWIPVGADLAFPVTAVPITNEIHFHTLDVSSEVVTTDTPSVITSGASSLVTVDTLPTFVRCLKIMRIK